jgi:2-polyprenyl-3-methyl-5-hydroxy-6-metoxy-1,4-benzoquinol methylase
VQNRLVRSHWTDVHAGVWAYSAAALKRIPFAFNSSGPAFDAEVAIQAGLAGVRCVEVAVPSRAHRRLGVVAGLTYAWDVTLACVKARAQELSLFFDRKFDCLPSTVSNIHYKPRLGFASTHTMALDRIPAGSRVLDIGCAGGDLGRMLRERGCTVVGVDRFPLEPGNTLDGFHLHDLNTPLPVDVSSFDYAAMLDVIEHLQSPETFVDDFKARAERNPNLRLILSTPNIGFIVNRLMLAAGQFNYGKRGILDLTHTRLFTFGTFRRLFEQSGFEIVELTGVPAPFPLALGDTLLARVLLSMHQGLIRVSRRLFAFQIFAIVRSKPGLAYLLNYVPENAAAKPTASLDR